MTRILLSVMLSFTFLSAYLQQDPEAKKILDKVSEKTRVYTTIQVNFNLAIDDRKEKTSSESEGAIMMKGGKYRLETGNNLVIFDGKTMWSIALDIKEVIITEPDMEDDDFISNPAKIFTWYNRDFKYRYVQQVTQGGISMHEIDLFPNNLDQPYSRIKVLISEKDLLLHSVKSVGKDGIDYTVELTNYILDKAINDDMFFFNPEKYKKFELIDMRF
ncbi:MAG: outer membrane lipoprotein carrier protein LolA [Bacteroidales bacterium]|nr:outer membrane lipoprotein carrier protein LolA [Bacteroidales bacterium]